MEIEHLMIASHSPLPPVTETRDTDVGSDALEPKPWPAVSARALVLARYLNAWRMRIERVGNRLLQLRSMNPALRGHLLLAVTLRADGTIAALHFVREARNPNLNRLALETIREAQPFPPLPQTRTGRQSFRFIYEWRFFNHHATADVAPLSHAHS
ncbi:TonB family protein [mine drainage metagenome]|uniref:TonB family protein n=1 Tax=mine drainage metagenome TaxID=410659 RepID=T1BTV3_9ZZZZ